MRKSFGCQPTLISTTLGIAESLSDEEMDRLKLWCNEQLVVLQRFANDYYVFEDLVEVKDLWGADREAEHQGSNHTNEMTEIPCGDVSDEEGVECERSVASTSIAPKLSRTALYVP